jgi:hypothetical protein
MIFGADYLQVMQDSKYEICKNRRSERNFFPTFPHFLSDLVNLDIRDLNIILFSICEFSNNLSRKSYTSVKYGHKISFARSS